MGFEEGHQFVCVGQVRDFVYNNHVRPEASDFLNQFRLIDRRDANYLQIGLAR